LESIADVQQQLSAEAVPSEFAAEAEAEQQEAAAAEAVTEAVRQAGAATEVEESEVSEYLQVEVSRAEGAVHPTSAVATCQGTALCVQCSILPLAQQPASPCTMLHL
jgi:hypothetical protein